MTIFRDDRDRGHLLELFETSVDRFRIEIHAYALMDTHYHLGGTDAGRELELGHAMAESKLCGVVQYQASAQRHCLSAAIWKRACGERGVGV